MRSELLETLREFNAKERFFLVGHVLGNPRFEVSNQFRTALSELLNLNIPDKPFCAMDFHLDWLYAALQVSAEGCTARVHANDRGIIKAQQEDIDLLVGYEGQDGYHLILVEAKAATGWTNGQMRSKAARMVQIFGRDGSGCTGVTPHFVLMSPREPPRLNTADWPSWMVPGNRWLWMPLDVPSDLKRVSRCDCDGRPCADGTFWTVLRR